MPIHTPYDASYWDAVYGDDIWPPDEQRLKFVIDHFNPRSVIEVGCAFGADLDAIHGMYPHLTLTGLDVSEYAVSKAVPHIKPLIIVCDLLTAPPPIEADLVMAFEVLEHFTDIQCATALERIVRMASNAAFSLPTSDRVSESEFFSDPTHVVYESSHYWRALFSLYYKSVVWDEDSKVWLCKERL